MHAKPAVAKMRLNPRHRGRFMAGPLTARARWPVAGRRSPVAGRAEILSGSEAS